MKTSELTGAALDWAVAKCEGWSVVKDPFLFHEIPAFSTDWAQGGPIIEREQINIQFCTDLRDSNGEYIHAEMQTHSHHGYWRGDHKQPLIAAMRCYVASKLGDDVEIPTELTSYP